MATAPLSLKSLLVPSKDVEVEYPGMPGFKVSVSFLSRETLTKLRKGASKTTFKNRQPVEDIDEKVFLQLYSEAAIKGWTGLKLKYVEQLAPIDLAGQDLEAELPFSAENALSLMQSSSSFDAFVSETVSDLGNFSTNSSAK